MKCPVCGCNYFTLIENKGYVYAWCLDCDNADVKATSPAYAIKMDLVYQKSVVGVGGQ